ncbi:Receptor-type tyrosine-protein phosphatase kappa [Geodia barretti]|uniref:Receptor-type tyrosine-protein phosphatase kappa n=1 Tax=Geodia barretti TaxID=519541 RepID=A0AA35WCX1_GEOBA|nr:Receptor-type tyrosine-protein phosphatase kappa [Geodia barretti]
MVWEYETPTILMLTQCTEAGKVKCVQYWPEKLHDSLSVGGKFRVTFSSNMPFAEYEFRKFKLENLSESESKHMTVSHLHYTAWPDHGVPDNVMSLIAFIRHVRKLHPVSHQQPLLVHCSAGVGRTGTLILLDIIMQQMKTEGTISVLHWLRNLRMQRMKMVQSQQQYEFIHCGLSELVVCGETEVAAANLRIALKNLTNKGPDGLTGFQRQMKGEDVVVYCDIDLIGVVRGRDVAVEVTWFQEGVPVRPDSRLTISGATGDVGGVHSSLTFSPVHFSDMATYECRVTLTPLLGPASPVSSSASIFLNISTRSSFEYVINNHNNGDYVRHQRNARKRYSFKEGNLSIARKSYPTGSVGEGSIGEGEEGKTEDIEMEGPLVNVVVDDETCEEDGVPNQMQEETEDYFQDPTSILLADIDPIPTERFPEYVRDMLYGEEHKLKEEFSAMGKLPQPPSTVAVLPHNKAHNRFNNIYPLSHLHYTAWPDHGVPDNVMSLIAFIRHVRKLHPVSHQQPLLVHCSAGVGRTGTLILLDIIMQQMKTEGTISVLHWLRNLRMQRMKMVQSQNQYEFIHCGLSELVVCGETEVAAANLRIAIKTLKNKGPVGFTGFQRQMQDHYVFCHEVVNMYLDNFDTYANFEFKEVI